MLHVVGCWCAVKLLSQQLPTFLLFHDRRSVAQQPAVRTYFGRAKVACLCSYCCNRHLCYDGGRLGRVKIVTLRVGARGEEGKGGGGKNTRFLFSFPAPYPAPFDSTHFLPSFRVSTCAFASKTFARPMKTPALQVTTMLDSFAQLFQHFWAPHAHYTWSPKSYGLYTFHDSLQLPTLLGIVALFAHHYHSGRNNCKKRITYK